MKKQKIQLIVLIAVLVLIAGSYFGLKNYNTRAEEAESVPEYTALSLGDDAVIKNLKVINASGEFDLEKQDDDTWILSSDNSIDVDEDKITTKVNSIRTITSDKVVDNYEKLSDFGLEEAAITIEITLDNGDTHTVKIGDYNDTASAYYLTVDDISTIYTVSATLFTNFNFDTSSITAVEEETAEDVSEAEETEETEAEETEAEETEAEETETEETAAESSSEEVNSEETGE